MTRGRIGLVAAVAALALAAAGPEHAPRGELVVRNQTFSSLEIFVVVGASERRIGSAPPKFSNTLYFQEPAGEATLRFQARLAGAREVVHESEAVDARAGMRLRWTLPDNRVDPLGGASRDDAARP